MRPGTNAEIRILSARDQSIIKTARKNLVKRGADYYLYKYETGKAVEQLIKIGRDFDLDVEILHGSAAGDTIITEGATLVSNGQKVRLVE